MRRIFTTFVVVLMLSGCVTSGNTASAGGGNKALLGMLLGGAGGGFLGSKIGKGKGRLAATAAGALLGALMGNSIGQSLDNADRMSANTATRTAIARAPVGQQIQWSNPNTGNYGRVMTTREGFQPRTNRYCREYQQEVTVGGRTQQAYGVACRQPDGSWEISNNGNQAQQPSYAQNYQQPYQQKQYYHVDNPPRQRYAPQPSFY